VTVSFTIESNDTSEAPAIQSVWYDTDIRILERGLAGVGVLTGCGVTAQGSPDMTVAVAAGTIQPSAGAAAVTVTSGNVTVGTAHATLPRLDLISAAADGTKTITAGTAAASPKPPALPSGHIGLAFIYVPATATTITTARITDKRCNPPASTGVAFKMRAPQGTGTMTTTSPTYVAIDATDLAYLTLNLAVGDVVRCMLAAQLLSSSDSVVSFDFEVDQPTSANVRVGEGADRGLGSQAGAAAFRQTVNIMGLFVATEAGVHGFRPMWLTDAGTASLANASSADSDSVVTFSVEKLGQPAA
jgi:hypothetical protein